MHNVLESEDQIGPALEDITAREPEISKDELQQQVQELVQRLAESSRREQELQQSKNELELKLQQMTIMSSEQLTTQHYLHSRKLHQAFSA